MIRRFMGDNIYQGGWFITTKTDGEGRVSYCDPLATASGKAFRAAVEGRVRYVKAAVGSTRREPGSINDFAVVRPTRGKCDFWDLNAAVLH
jgi:hypothetical protein